MNEHLNPIHVGNRSFGPHPKSLSPRERDFEFCFPFAPREKGLGDVDASAASRRVGFQDVTQLSNLYVHRNAG